MSTRKSTHKYEELLPEEFYCIATANAELGNRLIDLAAQRAAKLAQEMLKSGDSTRQRID